MTTKDAASILDLIAEKAPKLRAAGVSHVAIEGASFTIGQADDPGEAGEGDDDDDLDPLSDPATFGMRPKKGRTAPSLKSRSES